MNDVMKLVSEAQRAIKDAASIQELNAVRVSFLGRKGALTAVLRSLGERSPEERRTLGAEANQAKGLIDMALSERYQALSGSSYGNLAETEYIDVTERGKLVARGHLHPATQVIEQVIDVFHQLGYTVAEGPEAETDWYNFGSLNMPDSHPARDMQDTFYLENGMVARTHTSPVQVRYMEQNEPPIRIIAPGRAYRNEDEDAGHVWIFHQIEGLAIDKGLTMADLKGTLEAMVRGVLGDDAKLRLRPSYFPYTEPSAEMDVSCPRCEGKGCPTCGRTGWIELGGSGMVHPEVIRNGGHDPKIWQGFAFGFGPERLAMARYGIPDARLFWRTDMRFLEQF
jgi:phenylalanyl-tRNA synthetase alpha chain